LHHAAACIIKTRLLWPTAWSAITISRAAFDVPVWCGGMLEAGIGRAHNIHLSTQPNFRKPGDTSSSSRYFTKDIINEETTDQQWHEAAMTSLQALLRPRL
jgi:L-alanine-DL-glutamate epimerase-like enolase superfamily enzyme